MSCLSSYRDSGVIEREIQGVHCTHDRKAGGQSEISQLWLQYMEWLFENVLIKMNLAVEFPVRG